MQNAAQAYGKVANQIADPRALEADLLLKAASRLQAVHDGWETRRSELNGALTYNRRLWTIFLASVTSPDHQLPITIRQNVANLGLFVMNHTMTILATPKREQLGSLININRQLAAGLRGQ
jgi:flagellar biosynthesis activator protein FlaF